MKRTLTFGGVAVGLLASAAIATPANAAKPVGDTLAGSNFAAKQIAAFWFGEKMANLRKATPYNVETTVKARKVNASAVTSAGSRPGIVGSSNDKKAVIATSKNVNLPRTVGKVFFIGADRKPHWCSGTAVQSRYRNLVATAGHCVYDTKSNRETLDKWVFIPGYYQGKTPWGIYVGKQAFTHSDFTVFEDGDRDYAFVTVYNGVLPTSSGGSKPYVSRTYETRGQAEWALRRLRSDRNTGYTGLRIVPVVDTRHVVREGARDSRKVYVKRADWKKLNPEGTPAYGPFKEGTGVTDRVSTHKPKGWVEGKESRDGRAFYMKKDGKYVVRTYWINYDLDYKIIGRVVQIGLKDVGRLVDNVGGQGLAYNQKLGKNVFVFGYPSGSHPDGDHVFTGRTMKWSYGKTFGASAPAIKGDELQAVTSSFTGQGAIGSAWLLNYKNKTRLGYLTGVTISVADRNGNGRIDTSLSPYFDGETLAVYKSAANHWSGRIV